MQREAMLVNVQGAANANKFYHLTMDDNGVVTARWGRVGVAGTSQVKGNGDVVFDRLMRQKTSRGYQSVDVISNADNNSSKTVEKNVLKDVATKNLVNGDTALSTLVSRLVDVNRHDIIAVSGNSMKVDDSGLVRTPLGVLTTRQIDNAERVLDGIRDSSNVSPRVVDEYLTLVPQKVPARGDWHKEFFKEVTTVEAQRLFLSTLRSSVVTAEQAAKAAAKAQDSSQDVDDAYSDLFRYRIEVCDDASVFNKVSTLFEKSKNRTHHAGTSRMKLKKVYTIVDNEENRAKQEATASKLGNVRSLWHGTPAFNLLSIMRSGLVVPKRSTGSYVITGRMFGDGVYLSDQSTKALNYARGYAPGQSRVSSRMSFMLLADVAMGYEFRPNMMGFPRFDAAALRESRQGSYKGHKFSSISVKGGTCGVLNNEMVVWDTDQISLRYLCEFTEA